MKVFAAVIFTVIGVVTALAQNEQSPIVEKQLEYKNWTYKNVRSGEAVDLRDLASGKKLVLIVYFAHWCPNWRHEAPFAEALYEKYKGAGLDVVGISEYDTAAATEANLDFLKITFPVVYESETRDARTSTLHYQYRTTTGDKRKWGSPWNIFILPQAVEKKGDVLLRNAPVVNGELIEAEAEKFVRQKLGIAETDKMTASSEKKDAAEVCDPENQTTTLKKP
jgi:peroxiredoxin